jgi:hypothetical protein
MRPFPSTPPRSGPEPSAPTLLVDQKTPSVEVAIAAALVAEFEGKVISDEPPAKEATSGKSPLNGM